VTHAPMELIEWLGSASGGSAALGGKGASLDTLARLGFRVPPGFCLTTAAFRLQLGSRAGAADTADAARVALAEAVERPLGQAIYRLVANVAEAGFEPRFAVRSSAIGEDGSAASYAGLHETELDVAPADIPGAVLRCWASLWSPAAVAYRERRSLSAEDVEMAVVVQALVPADAAAVVFTRHPVTGRDDQLVLTAVRGLGDAMVSGTVTPDTYVVDRASRAVAQFEPGEDPAGPALQPDALAELVELAYAVEERLGRAVDIETAYAGGRWYLLQARPITTGTPGASGAATASSVARA
jgi:phosphoenolpyruvate synthase/pyruvate phosphate dikinase